MASLEERGEGVSLRVRVVPRARRDALVAEEAEHFVVRLAAPPVEGKANEALRRLLAEVFDIRPSAVDIAVGEKSRVKTVRVAGVTGQRARQRIDACLRAEGP